MVAFKVNVKFLGTVLVLAACLALGALSQDSDQKHNRECDVPTYNGKDLDRRPKISAKPAPNFSDREHKEHHGRLIVLRAILCGSGNVTDIEVKQGISDSLNERAIEAARKIQFTPGQKDGNNVSRFVTLVYRLGI